jgi:hypothetical protein
VHLTKPQKPFCESFLGAFFVLLILAEHGDKIDDSRVFFKPGMSAISVAVVLAEFKRNRLATLVTTFLLPDDEQARTQA